RGERFVAVTRRARGVALVLQDTRDQLADINLVVDDENIGRHAPISRSRPDVSWAPLRPRPPPLRGPLSPHYWTARTRQSSGRRRRSAGASTRRGRRAPPPARRTARACRRAPRESFRRWRARGRSPSRGW